MPEAVSHFAEAESVREVREIHYEIINSYILDFAKHAAGPDIPKLTLIWESIPKHLAKENKKFVFSAVRKGARAREYENALRWLQDAGLVHLCYALETSKVPLKHYADLSCYKVYVLDVGLLGTMVRSPLESMVDGERLFNEYEGALWWRIMWHNSYWPACNRSSTTGEAGEAKPSLISSANSNARSCPWRLKPVSAPEAGACGPLISSSVLAT